MTNYKQDFPIFSSYPELVYLDSAATSQKPQAVIDAISHYYQTNNANVHRGIHQLSNQSSQVWEESRQTIADFFKAQSGELIITRNTTEAMNGIAYGWADWHLQKDDIIIAGLMDHHASLVVWQEACRRTGAKLKLIPVTEAGFLDLEWLKKHLKSGVKLLSLTHVSNTLGTLIDIESIARQAKKVGAKVVIDAAQSAPHLPLNFTNLKKAGVDFLVFSGHKMLGPMGIGGLLVRQELLTANEFKPWLFGGGMIAAVYPEHTKFHPDPAERFTAGTPDVASLVGLATACNYLRQIGMQKVREHDRELVAYALKKLTGNKKVKIVGPLDSTKRVGSVTFLYEGVHPHDVAQILDSQKIAVRSGHHCCMPLHLHFNWPATVRASFNLYNTKSEIDKLVDALNKVDQVFQDA